MPKLAVSLCVNIITTHSNIPLLASNPGSHASDKQTNGVGGRCAKPPSSLYPTCDLIATMDAMIGKEQQEQEQQQQEQQQLQQSDSPTRTLRDVAVEMRAKVVRFLEQTSDSNSSSDGNSNGNGNGDMLLRRVRDQVRISMKVIEEALARYGWVDQRRLLACCTCAALTRSQPGPPSAVVQWRQGLSGPFDPHLGMSPCVGISRILEKRRSSSRPISIPGLSLITTGALRRLAQPVPRGANLCGHHGARVPARPRQLPRRNARCAGRLPRRETQGARHVCGHAEDGPAWGAPVAL